jgi:hypothetical protein
MTTSRNKSKKLRKTRRGGANECERLPFSRLSYDELHNNYQKYCMNSNPLKNMLNKNCCITLKNKFKNWTTDGRDFDQSTERHDYNDQYNKINNIPEHDSYISESFVRTSMGGKYKKNTKKKTRKYRK